MYAVVCGQVEARPPSCPHVVWTHSNTAVQPASKPSSPVTLEHIGCQQVIPEVVAAATLPHRTRTRAGLGFAITCGRGRSGGAWVVALLRTGRGVALHHVVHERVVLVPLFLLVVVQHPETLLQALRALLLLLLEQPQILLNTAASKRLFDYLIHRTSQQGMPNDNDTKEGR